MKTKYIVAGFCGFAFILLYNALLIHRDQQMFKAYDACMQFTWHPDCPKEWKTKPAFAHR